MPEIDPVVLTPISQGPDTAHGKGHLGCRSVMVSSGQFWKQIDIWGERSLIAHGQFNNNSPKLLVKSIGQDVGQTELLNTTTATLLRVVK